MSLNFGGLVWGETPDHGTPNFSYDLSIFNIAHSENLIHLALTV